LLFVHANWSFHHLQPGKNKLPGLNKGGPRKGNNRKIAPSHLTSLAQGRAEVDDVTGRLCTHRAKVQLPVNSRLYSHDMYKWYWKSDLVFHNGADTSEASTIP
jgi:hypothetical protein